MIEKLTINIKPIRSNMQLLIPFLTFNPPDRSFNSEKNISKYSAKVSLKTSIKLLTLSFSG